MVYQIIKRDGRLEPFDKRKIIQAIYLAYREGDAYVPESSERIATTIEQDSRETLDVEQVQDLVVQGLIIERLPEVAKRYILYRAERSRIRRERSDLSRRVTEVLDGVGIRNSNANVDEHSFGGRKFEVANALHREFALEKYMTAEVARAHRDHRIYIHDLSEYTVGDHNCLFVDLQRLLSNGFETRNGTVRPAQSFSTACQLVAVIFQCQSQVQFGGVASAHIDYDLAPYVRKSFARHIADGLIWIEGAAAEELLSYTDGISIDDRTVDQWPGAKAYALAMMEREGSQAAQGLYHNLNTLESRAGSQLPFSSINFGTDTSPEGRLVTKWLLEASIAGIGKHHSTPIFPISVFKYKRGINDVPGTPNYDLRLLSEKSLCNRIYPNIVNCGFSRNEEDGNPNTEMATMGCVERSEVVTYKVYDKLFVEGIGKMFDRLSIFGVSKHGSSEYIPTEGRGVSIYDSISNGFVECKKVIRNPEASDWFNMKFNNGRSLLATGDHPLPIVGKGRTFVKDAAQGDSVPVTYKQYAEEKESYRAVITPYIDALILCDGSYASGVVAYFGLDETDIIDKARQEARELGYIVSVSKKERGLKGEYYELHIALGDMTHSITQAYGVLFGGPPKSRRSIPSAIFSAPRHEKLAFLAGLIDADGSLNRHTSKGKRFDIGSTNKELALQEMALIQSLGIPCKVYQNHYKHGDTLLRYKLEFPYSAEVAEYMASRKKKTDEGSCDMKTPETASITSITPVTFRDCSFDLETASDTFDISGICSHNCRTMLGYDRHGLGYSKTGRGNVCPVTINLPRIALRYRPKGTPGWIPDLDSFWAELDEVLNLAKKALLERFTRICSQPARCAPFMYKNGTIAEAMLCNDEGVEPSMRHSTLALGYIGIAETCQALFGHNHAEDNEVHAFALEVVKRIYEFCVASSEAENLNFSCYATPAESLCHTFAKANREEFGLIENVTDREYITNSHHVPVWQNISIMQKLKVEAPFCKYATGGCITYVELDGSVMKNPTAVRSIVDAAMELDIPYLAFNFPIDTCDDCGFSGEIEGDCPACGSGNITRLRRVTGYLTRDYRNFNSGKVAECLDRVKHAAVIEQFDGQMRWMEV